MCAMTPRLRILLRSIFAAAMASPPGDINHRDTEDTEKFKTGVLASLCALCVSVVNSTRSPGEVRERLVRLGHLDGVLALGHRLALAAVGGEELVGQAQEHGPAALAAGGADDP